MATAQQSRAYTISLPPELVQKAEALANLESRTVGELLSEAFRAYYAQWVTAKLDEIGEYAASLNSPCTEADIPGLIAEVRVESNVRSDVSGQH